MKDNKYLENAVGFSCTLLGFIIGVALSLIAVRISAKHSQGYGLECANIVLNNSSTVIDTIQTIRNQDTTTTYEFVKKGTKMNGYELMLGDWVMH